MSGKIEGVIVLLSASLCACGGADGADRQPPAQQEQFSSTVVVFDPDGTWTATTRMITAAEQAQRDALRQARIERKRRAEDGGRVDGVGQTSSESINSVDCSDPNSMMLRDDFNRRGDEICFVGQGTALLHDFRRGMICGRDRCFLLYWDGAVKSYWAGDNSGTFYGPPIAPNQLFSAYPFRAHEEWNGTPDPDPTDKALHVANQLVIYSN